MHTLADRLQPDLGHLRGARLRELLYGISQELIAHGDLEVIDQQYIITDQGWHSLADYDTHPRPGREEATIE